MLVYVVTWLLTFSLNGVSETHTAYQEMNQHDGTSVLAFAAQETGTPNICRLGAQHYRKQLGKMEGARFEYMECSERWEYIKDEQ